MASASSRPSVAVAVCLMACAAPGGGVQPVRSPPDAEKTARRDDDAVGEPRVKSAVAPDAPATRVAPADAGAAALAPPVATGAPVTTEVRGRLVWREPRYRLLVKGGASPAGHEVALDLWISENKVLARRLEQLRDKDVIITGPVVPVPKGSVITADADYTSGFRDFEIREAK
ncbi:MAG: hypothetical protein IPG50_15790 [Myxococcales bacterium]|nr:hypothetical protein [Myxococcales bacterium]